MGGGGQLAARRRSMIEAQLTAVCCFALPRPGYRWAMYIGGGTVLLIIIIIIIVLLVRR